MKRFVRSILIQLIIFSISLTAIGCVEKTSPVEDFEYEIKDGYVIITGYKGVEREIYVPSIIDSRPVTIIGESAFAEYDMTSIVLPDTIVVIEEKAFKECVCLEKVVFSDSLEKIDKYAFYECTSLKKIDFPQSLKDIREFTFSYCESLEEVELPDGLEHLRNSSFANCDSLKMLNIPENTDLHIYLGETSHPIAGTFATFTCPLGTVTHSLRDSITPYSTILSFKEGSKAYEQVISCIGYEKYLVVEVQ